MISSNDVKRDPGLIRPSFGESHWATPPEMLRPGQLAAVPSLPVVLLLTSAMFAAGIYTLSSRFGMDLTRATALLGVYGIWALCAAILARRTGEFAMAQKPRRSAMHMALSAFLIMFAMSTVFVGLSGKRPDFTDVARQSLIMLYPAICFFALSMAAGRLNAERSALVSCHVIVTLSAASVALDYAGVTRIEIFGDRYFGFLGDGVAWLLTLPLVVYFSSSRFVLASLAAATLMLTLSRGPFLVVGGALLFLLVLSRGRRWQYLLSAAILSAVIAYQAEQFSALTERFTDVSILHNDRVITSLNGLKVFWESPVYGYGYNGLSFVFPFIASAQTLYGEHAVAMSPLVQVLSDGGALAFAGYLAFVIASTITSYKLLRLGKLLPPQSTLPGMAAWLMAMLWLNQTASWLLAGSYVAPVVYGVAGIVAGSYVRLTPKAQSHSPVTYRDRPALAPIA